MIPDDNMISPAPTLDYWSSGHHNQDVFRYTFNNIELCLWLDNNMQICRYIEIYLSSKYWIQLKFIQDGDLFMYICG